MSTTSAFITSTKGWEDIRGHPAMAWMEGYTNAFDSKEVLSAPYTDWLTKDFQLHAATGQVFPPGEESFEGVKQIYAPFASTLHEPTWVAVWETKDGWYLQTL